MVSRGFQRGVTGLGSGEGFVVRYQRLLRIGQRIISVLRFIDLRFARVGVCRLADGVDLRDDFVGCRLIRCRLVSPGFQFGVAGFSCSQCLIVRDKRLLRIGQSIVSVPRFVDLHLEGFGIFHRADVVDLFFYRSCGGMVRLCRFRLRFEIRIRRFGAFQLVIVFNQRLLRVGQGVIGVSRFVDLRLARIGVFHAADGVDLRFHCVRSFSVGGSLLRRGLQLRVAIPGCGQRRIVCDQLFLRVSQRVIGRFRGVDFVLAFVGVFHLADGFDQIFDQVRVDNVGIELENRADSRPADGHREASVDDFDSAVGFIGDGERHKAEALRRRDGQMHRFAHGGGLFVRGDRAVARRLHVHGVQDILPCCRDDLIAVHGDRVADLCDDGPAVDLHAPAAEGLARGRGEITGGQSEAAAGDDRNAVHLAAAAVGVKADCIERAAVLITADGADVVFAREGMLPCGECRIAVSAVFQMRVGGCRVGGLRVIAFTDDGGAVPLHAGCDPVRFRDRRVVDGRPDAHFAFERQEARGHVVFITAFGDTDGVGNVIGVGGKRARYGDRAAGDGDAAVFLVAVRAAADARRRYGVEPVVV